MDNLYSPAIVKEIQRRYGFRFSKSLGQNFLIDGNIVNKIIEGAGIREDDLVLEIGPGMGVLTDAACRRAGWVTAVEIDQKLIPILKEVLSFHKNLTIINGDILKIDLSKFIQEGKSNNPSVKNVKVMGNLPYYITTPIILKLLEERVPAKSITVMLQKEVADRIQAGPGTKVYGALSVAIQYYCTIARVASVPKETFLPRPKVDSSVIRLDIREASPVELLDETTFFNVVRSSFGKRRKTLANGIADLNSLGKDGAVEALTKAGIDPIRRAETLNLEEFASLANEVWKLAVGKK